MSHRGDYRSIYSVLPDSPEYELLSKDASILLFVVKLSLGPSGIGVLFDDQMQRRAKLTRRQLATARRELVDHDWLQVEKHVWWLRNGLKFEPSVTLSNQNHRRWVEKYLRGLPKLAIVNRMAAYYGLVQPFPDVSLSQNRGEGMGVSPPPSHPDGMPMGSPIPLGITDTDTETDTEPETLTDTDTEKRSETEGSRVREAEPPDQSSGQPDASHEDQPPELGGYLERWPDIAELVAGLQHDGTPMASARAIESRYLYDDGDDVRADDSVTGLTLDERERLVHTALLEYATQPEPWTRPLFSGFVRRLRETKGAVHTSAPAPQPYHEPEPEIDPEQRAEVAALSRDFKAKLKGDPTPEPRKRRRTMSREEQIAAARGSKPKDGETSAA